MRKTIRLSLLIGAAAILACGNVRHAGVSVADFVDEIHATVFYGTKEPPYGEDVREPFGLGQNIAFNVGTQMAVNGGARQVTDAEGLLQIECLFEVAFGNAICVAGSRTVCC